MTYNCLGDPEKLNPKNNACKHCIKLTECQRLVNEKNANTKDVSVDS